MSDGIHFRLSLLYGHTRPQPRDHSEVSVITVDRGTGWNSQRCPQFGGGWIRDAVRQHSDNVVRLAVQGRRFAYNSTVSAKAGLPKAITQNDNVVLTRLVFVRQESAAQKRRNAQHLKVIGRQLIPNNCGWIS